MSPSPGCGTRLTHQSTATASAVEVVHRVHSSTPSARGSALATPWRKEIKSGRQYRRTGTGPAHDSVSTMDVGIVGGTGPAGRALGARLASVGLQVVIGSRSA